MTQQTLLGSPEAGKAADFYLIAGKNLLSVKKAVANPTPQPHSEYS